MAEEGSIFGAGGILGTNNLQRAVDGFNRAVDTLSSIVGKLGQASASYQHGANTAGSWNKFSNWAGNRNGGYSSAPPPPSNGGTPPVGNGGWAPYMGTPFNPNAPRGYAQTTTGLYVPNGWAGIPNGGYQPTPPTPASPTAPPAPPRLNGRVGKAVFAAGMINTGYQHFTQTRNDSNADSMLMATAAAQASMNGTPANMRMMFGNSWGYMNTADLTATKLGIYQNSGNVVGSAGYQNYVNSIQSMTLANPMMSGTQALNSATQFYNPSRYSKLFTVGINTIGNHGKRQSLTQIANQVLNQVDPSQSIRDAKSAAALVNDPLSNLNVTLGNWVANGIISGDQVAAIKDQIAMILKARQHNVGANQLSKLIAERKTNNAADKKLQSMGIGNTAIQREKDLAAAQRQPTVDRLPEFNNALQESTKSIVGFTNALRDFTSNPNNPIGRIIGSITGTWRGESTHGWGWGLVNELGTPGLSSIVGGSAESRMSMPRGGATVSSQPHSAGGSGVGGPAPGTSTGASGGSGGGSSSSTKGSSGGVRLAWPTSAHGPITAGFGQSGTHWSSGYHTGLDIGVGTGTPVHAAAPGHVIYAGWNSAYGNVIKIDHGSGVVTLYGHNSRLVAHNGAQVRTGQLIAYSGATGNVTGPHVHFEVDINGTPVNPLKYLTGAATLNLGGTSSGGGGTSGSGTTSDNGAGAAFGGSASSGGVGLNELDVLMGALTGGSTGGVAGASAGVSGSPGGGGGYQHVPGGGTSSQNVALGKKLAAKYGWGSGKQWDALYKLWMRESGWRTNADNPSSSAYGIAQAMIGQHQLPKGYYDRITGSGGSVQGYGGDPSVQIQWGLQYIKSRYGSPAAAWAHEAQMNWYDKGAWNIPEDQVAKVHKREMIIPAKEADQIREILVNGNPYGASTKGSHSGAQVSFAPNSISIVLQGTGNSESDGRALGKAFVDTMLQDRRITNLQNGVFG